MKSRESLLRYKSFLVDERRRELGVIFDQIGTIDARLEQLTVELSLEQIKAGESDVAHYAYASYAQGNRYRCDELGQEKLQLEIEAESAQEALMEAYRELKKIEVLEERRMALEEQEQKYLERIELDEIATDRFRRKG